MRPCVCACMRVRTCVHSIVCLRECSVVKEAASRPVREPMSLFLCRSGCQQPRVRRLLPCGEASACVLRLAWWLRPQQPQPGRLSRSLRPAAVLLLWSDGVDVLLLRKPTSGYQGGRRAVFRELFRPVVHGFVWRLRPCERLQGRDDAKDSWTDRQTDH